MGNRSSCEGNILPQLSMRDLQCLDAVPQAPGMSDQESQALFHLQQGENTGNTSNTRVQNHLGSQNQGPQTMWSNFSTSDVHNTFHGSVTGGGGGAQGLASFPLLEGMEENEFMKGLMAGGSQTALRLKQESEITAGQETHECVMQFHGESQENTYTNLLTRPNNSRNNDAVRQDGGGNIQPLNNLQNPYSNNGPEVHFSTVADWIKASRHSEYPQWHACIEEPEAAPV